MKVLQVLPEMNSGGVERGTLELAAHLAAHGHQSLVLSGGGRLVPRLEAAGSRHITLPVGRKSLSTLLLISKLRRLLETERPDILHLRSRVPAWVLWFAWHRLHPKDRPHLVTTVHGFYSVSRWSEIMTRGERVICVSESIRDYVLQNYPSTPNEILRVVPRGVDPAEYPFGFRPEPAWRRDFETQFPETREKRLITLPGRITRLKGHEDLLTLLRGLSDLPDIHALVVGGAHPRKQAYLEEVRKKVRDAGLENRITFTGNRDDLRNILALSTLVLSLTQQPESFGRTTLEALAMGIPVAGYDHGGVGEQLNVIYPQGKLLPNAPEAAIPIIRQLLADAPSVRRPNPFTLQAMLMGTLEVYRELHGEG
ncbi:glycosyltransferase involved in cell wall biosynthesis [Haloferula luteola]|uniref:Glycosyltransferase involved in cell wall biosynthesis n=1 Tax=Haloferula luteola TaxID=595692 RepID=A0A840UWV5_9BACT|nr:glycosyltransferase family 4 protein [Haloferula luteola]MBB5350637.1 glycosyltransferase involved in cell wall biosynthesis [Haloferula luteola]